MRQNLLYFLSPLFMSCWFCACKCSGHLASATNSMCLTDVLAPILPLYTQNYLMVQSSRMLRFVIWMTDQLHDITQCFSALQELIWINEQKEHFHLREAVVHFLICVDPCWGARGLEHLSHRWWYLLFNTENVLYIYCFLSSFKTSL